MVKALHHPPAPATEAERVVAFLVARGDARRHRPQHLLGRQAGHPKARFPADHCSPDLATCSALD
jgi:hypothetical protein